MITTPCTLTASVSHLITSWWDSCDPSVDIVWECREIIQLKRTAHAMGTSAVLTGTKASRNLRDAAYEHVSVCACVRSCSVLFDTVCKCAHVWLKVHVWHHGRMCERLASADKYVWLVLHYMQQGPLQRNELQLQSDVSPIGSQQNSSTLHAIGL